MKASRKFKSQRNSFDVGAAKMNVATYMTRASAGGDQARTSSNLCEQKEASSALKVIDLLYQDVIR